MEYRDYRAAAEASNRKNPISKNALIGILTIGLALGFAVGLVFASPLGWSKDSANVLYDESKVTSLFDEASPAVVEINISRNFGRILIPGTGTGSGFLIDTEGHIVTNNHVVENASALTIKLSDGREIDAQKLGTSAADDLAVIKVDPNDIRGIEPLTLADSSTVRPGQLAVAIGSPFKQLNSIGVGVVSGTGRGLPSVLRRPIPDMIQTDAPLNPGNSGGPLLNADGDVIGVNSSVRTGDLGNEIGEFRIGFAVPSNTVISLLPDLKESAEVRRPWIGISGQPVSKQMIDTLGFPEGVYVSGVARSSPASKAGISPFRSFAGNDQGDIITAIDDRPVGSVDDMVSYLNSKSPGDEIKISVYRDRQTVDLAVILDPWPDT
ncbi:MAG: trypsin-like peptidase domain-containing protein [SAR202 cluster bacterium]|jgi:2-alkenal reductase|nr:trypsin-like peptidase domain-containing protein [SAR202 cluster bacterium]MDP6514689.1 trypsin-like peptidase domain-containing protein [SAR202 cluster bacterium]MDP6714783.1 trypsin-like peptidase domain-containing protein [SAR202 cluster bacterium]